MKRILAILILVSSVFSLLLSAGAYAQGGQPIEIIFAGDTMMDWSVRSAVNRYGPDFPFRQVRNEVYKADYAILNLETAITNRSIKYKKTFNFKSDSKSLSGIKNAGFDMVNLANNHTLDYRVDGFVDTLRNLSNYQLAYVGGGYNNREAYAAKTVLVKNKKVKFLAFSQIPPMGWGALNNRPGVADGYNISKIINIIKSERKSADYLIVFFHWGREGQNRPSSAQRLNARHFIDAGTDLVVGSHPHVLQGFEYYKGKPIAYSLGNFLFPSYVHGRNAQTGLLKLKIQDNNLFLEFKPYYIRNNQVTKMSTRDEASLLSYLRSISYNVKINGYEVRPYK